MTRWLMVVGFAFIAACSTSSGDLDLSSLEKLPAKELPPLPPGSARIVLLRAASAGSAQVAEVLVEGVGRLPLEDNRYRIVDLAPGDPRVRCEGFRVEVQVAAGQTRYVLIAPTEPPGTSMLPTRAHWFRPIPIPVEIGELRIRSLEVQGPLEETRGVEGEEEEDGET